MDVPQTSARTVSEQDPKLDLGDLPIRWRKTYRPSGSGDGQGDPMLAKLKPKDRHDEHSNFSRKWDEQEAKNFVRMWDLCHKTLLFVHDFFFPPDFSLTSVGHGDRQSLELTQYLNPFRNASSISADAWPTDLIPRLQKLEMLCFGADFMFRDQISEMDERKIPGQVRLLHEAPLRANFLDVIMDPGSSKERRSTWCRHAYWTLHSQLSCGMEILKGDQYTGLEKLEISEKCLHFGYFFTNWAIEVWVMWYQSKRLLPSSLAIAQPSKPPGTRLLEQPPKHKTDSDYHYCRLRCFSLSNQDHIRDFQSLHAHVMNWGQHEYGRISKHMMRVLREEQASRKPFEAQSREQIENFWRLSEDDFAPERSALKKGIL